MKIALLLSGEMRNYYDNINNNYQYIINPLKPDIFMSIWNFKTKDPKCKSYSTGSIDDCIEQYNPIITQIIDKKINFNLTERSGLINNGLTTVHNFVGMCYQQYQVSLLKQQYEKENNFTYDVVIKHRHDLIINSSFEQYLHLVDDNTILVPYGNDFHNGLNDLFAIGSSKTIDIYMDLYNHIVELNNILPIHPERALRQWLVNINKIRILRITLPMKLREYQASWPLTEFYIDDTKEVEI